MHRKQKQVVHKQKVDQPIELCPQVRNLLSFEYLTHFPQKVNSFDEMVQITLKGLQDNIFRLKYNLTSQHIYRYGIKDFQLRQCPFPKKQYQLIQQISNICDTILRKRDYVTANQSLNKLNTLLHGECQHISLRDQNEAQMQRIQSLPYDKLKAKQQRAFHQKQLSVFKEEENFAKSRMKIHLMEQFKDFNLNFKYLNIKQAIVYEALSRCQIMFTICRERKKSGKGFHLDPLINTFDYIVRKAQIPPNSAFHISVLPRKNVRKLEIKKNIEKTKNPLYDAVASRNHNEVKQLILNGADLQAPAFGDERMGRQLRCAHKAALNNDLEMCKILTSFGVNWQSLDSELMTPIFYTVQGRSLQVVKYLVEQIKVNIQHQEIQDRTPFYWACTQGQLDFIKYLYSKGVNVNSKSKLGRCPLSKACFLGRIDIIEFLMSCPEIDILSKDGKGRTALHNATFGPKGGREGQKFGTNASDSPDIAQFLLEKGFPVDEPDFEKNTSLHIAASSQALNSIPILMAFGASLTVRNDYGQTPLMTAAKFGHFETVKMLYERYNSSITEKDIFGKNILMLVAKFRQFKENTFKNFPAEGSVEQKNNFRKQNTSMNPVFVYIIDKLIFECYTKFLTPEYQDEKFDQEKKDKLNELHESFFEMLKHGVHEEFMLLIQKLIEFKVPFPELKLKDVKCLLEMEQFFEGEAERKVVTQILHSKNQEGYHVFQLQKQGIKQFITWLIQKNSISLLQFVSQNQVLVFYHFNQKNHKEEQQTYYELPMSLLVNSISVLKEKVITFCLLNLNFNWIDFVDETTGGNLLHILVKNRKVGSLIQVTKLLGGKKLNFAKNRFVIELMDKEELAEQHHKNEFDFNQSPINQLFVSLLSQQDNDGITPYKLAHIIKETSIIKILSQRLKQSSLTKGSDVLEKLDVKEFKIERQLQDQQQIKLFEMGHEKEKELQKFIERIQACKTGEQVSKFMRILASNPKELGEKINIETDVETQWNNFKLRPLHLIKNQNDIHLLKPILNGPKVVGIDVEYDFADGNQTIICIIQFSTLEEDFIVDMMSCTFENGQNRYIHFVKKLKETFFEPLSYDQTITKLMHGSDHDLYILKSCFNCSFVNFLDSSRIDVDIRRFRDQANKKSQEDTENGISQTNKITENGQSKMKARCVRGLAILAKEYLNITMSKDHQISEWKIRPLPASMIDYARRDSMVMPFLVHKLLKSFDKIEDLKESIINGLRISKKNKKVNQPLIKNIIPI